MHLRAHITCTMHHALCTMHHEHSQHRCTTHHEHSSLSSSASNHAQDRAHLRGHAHVRAHTQILARVRVCAYKSLKNHAITCPCKHVRAHLCACVHERVGMHTVFSRPMHLSPAGCGIVARLQRARASMHYCLPVSACMGMHTIRAPCTLHPASCTLRPALCVMPT
jgi:hypothetical protein